MYEHLDGHFKERSRSWSHMFGTQIPSIQGFGASNMLSRIKITVV